MTGILYPVFVEVALTFALFFWMAYERFKAFRDGQVQKGAHRGIPYTWPERAAIVSNAFHNQLEVPMLFYAVVAFSMLTGAADHIMVLLAWAFVLLRLVHAAIHTTYNHVPHRFYAYAFSSMFVVIMWIKLFLHVVTAGAAA